MTSQPCPRCSRSWPDRHPAATVTAGLFTLVFMGMMLSVHPVASAAMVTLIGVAVTLYRHDQQRRRHAELGARADWEHRRLMAELDRSAAAVPMRAPTDLAPRYPASLLPTTPLRTGRDES